MGKACNSSVGSRSTSALWISKTDSESRTPRGAASVGILRNRAAFDEARHLLGKPPGTMQKHLAFMCLPSVLISLGGCGEARSNPVGGAFGQGLQVSPDASVTTATYAISGPNGFARTGIVRVGDSADVPVMVSPLPVGRGYRLDLSATASDGVIGCTGRTNFDVADSSATLTLIVHLECAVPSGGVDLQTKVNLCPVLDGLSASPLALRLGGVSSLSMAGHDSDNGPARLAYSWSVNGVSLPRQTRPTLSFACSSVGEVTIAATVSDGDPDPTCADSSSVKVSCE